MAKAKDDAMVDFGMDSGTTAPPAADEALMARIRDLEAQLATRAPEPTVAVEEFPTTVYRKLDKATDRWPSGYEARQVANAEELQRLGKGWVDSPVKLAMAVLLAVALSAGPAHAGPIKAIATGVWKVVKPVVKPVATLTAKAGKALY